MQIQWTQRLAVGIETIDKQHQELISRVNRLLDALEKDDKAQTVLETLNFLDNYVVEHFGTEERMMLDGWYPEYMQHRAQHTDFIYALGKVKAGYAANGASVGLAMALHSWLSRWITAHISQSDRALCDYLRSPSAAPAALKSKLSDTPNKPVTATVILARGQLLGQILVQLGKLTAQQAVQAVSESRARREQVGHYLMRQGWVTPVELCHALAVQSGLQMADPGQLHAPDGRIFPALLMLRHQFVPFKQTRESVCVASNHPLSMQVLGELEKHCGKHVVVYLAPDDKLAQLLSELEPHKTQQARRQVRHSVGLPIHYYCCNSQGQRLSADTLAGQTLEVGESGLKLEGPASALGTPEQLLARATHLAVRFSLHPYTVDAFGLLKNIAPQTAPADPFSAVPPEQTLWQYDLEFGAMPEENHVLLRQVCIRIGLWSSRRTGLYPSA